MDEEEINCPLMERAGIKISDAERGSYICFFCPFDECLTEELPYEIEIKAKEIDGVAQLFD